MKVTTVLYCGVYAIALCGFALALIRGFRHVRVARRLRRSCCALCAYPRSPGQRCTECGTGESRQRAAALSARRRLLLACVFFAIGAGMTLLVGMPASGRLYGLLPCDVIRALLENTRGVDQAFERQLVSELSRRHVSEAEYGRLEAAAIAALNEDPQCPDKQLWISILFSSKAAGGQIDLSRLRRWYDSGYGRGPTTIGRVHREGAVLAAVKVLRTCGSSAGDFDVAYSVMQWLSEHPERLPSLERLFEGQWVTEQYRKYAIMLILPRLGRDQMISLVNITNHDSNAAHREHVLTTIQTHPKRAWACQELCDAIGIIPEVVDPTEIHQRQEIWEGLQRLMRRK